jgi:hypothetical protein
MGHNAMDTNYLMDYQIEDLTVLLKEIQKKITDIFNYREEF